MKVSIVISTFQRTAWLRRSLESLQRAERPQGWEIECLVVVNGGGYPESRLAREVLRELGLCGQVMECTRRSPGAARNRALDAAAGDFIFFLDDDAFIAPDYFKRAARLFAEFPMADVLGGPEITHENASPFQKDIGCVLGSPLATSITRWRHRVKKQLPFETTESTLTLCNLWIRRATMNERPFRFDEQFFRNEETVLLQALRRIGARLLHAPCLWVYHERRSTWTELARAVSASGRFRRKSFEQSGPETRWIHGLPTLFLAYVGSMPFFWLKFGTAVTLPFLIYLGAIAALSANFCIRGHRPASSWPRLMGLHLWILFFYGRGFATRERPTANPATSVASDLPDYSSASLDR